MAARLPPVSHRPDSAAGDCEGGAVSRGQVRPALPGLQSAGAPLDLVPFRLELFRDYLALEAGNSRHTVENYLLDAERLAAWARGAGAHGPDEVTAAQLREFIYHLKDAGLAPATIRRQISAIRTYYRFLVGEGHAARDPSERLESPKGWRGVPSGLSVGEGEELIAAPDTDTPLGIPGDALL